MPRNGKIIGDFDIKRKDYTEINSMEMGSETPEPDSTGLG
jgi:hypothetical protein